MRLTTKKLTEHAHQATYFEWVRAQARFDKRYEYIFAIPNARKASDRARIYYWKEGLEAGVPDVFVAYPIQSDYGDETAYMLPGLWIEFKRGGQSKLTEAQIKWLKRFKDCGFVTTVAHSFDDARRITTAYFSLDRGRANGTEI